MLIKIFCLPLLHNAVPASMVHAIDLRLSVSLLQAQVLSKQPNIMQKKCYIIAYGLLLLPKILVKFNAS